MAWNIYIYICYVCVKEWLVQITRRWQCYISSAAPPWPLVTDQLTWPARQPWPQGITYTIWPQIHLRHTRLSQLFFSLLGSWFSWFGDEVKVSVWVRCLGIWGVFVDHCETWRNDASLKCLPVFSKLHRLSTGGCYSYASIQGCEFAAKTDVYFCLVCYVAVVISCHLSNLTDYSISHLII